MEWIVELIVGEEGGIICNAGRLLEVIVVVNGGRWSSGRSSIDSSNSSSGGGLGVVKIAMIIM